MATLEITDDALRFAIQLYTLRNTGRFLTDYRAIALKVANYLTQQLETDPVLFVPEPVREATEYRYQAQIRTYAPSTRLWLFFIA